MARKAGGQAAGADGEDVVMLAIPADRAYLIQRLLAWPPAFLQAWVHAGEIALLERPPAADVDAEPRAVTRVRPGAKVRYREKRCEVCGIDFLGNALSRYCSGRCRARAHAERHREDGPAVEEQPPTSGSPDTSPLRMSSRADR